YAFLAHALLALHQATNDPGWRDQARKVLEQMKQRFSGNEAFYFTSSDAKDLIVRQKTGSDSPLPNRKAVAAIVALNLDQPDVARGVLSTFAQSLVHQAEGMSGMLQAALAFVRAHGPLEVAASAEQRKSDRPLSPQELAARVLQIAHKWRDRHILELR